MNGATGYTSTGPRRRARSGSPHGKDGEYVIHLEDVRSGKDTRTTLMIKNIPNAYVIMIIMIVNDNDGFFKKFIYNSYKSFLFYRFTREVILEIVDQFCKDKYNYFYLPIDHKTDCNLGYGYINMVDTESVIRLYNEVCY